MKAKQRPGASSSNGEDGGFFIGAGEAQIFDSVEKQEKVGLVQDVEAGPTIEDLVMDLHVETQLNFDEGEEEYETAFIGKEFLSAMVVVPGSNLAGKTMAHSGINKLPGVHLFSIERPLSKKSLRRVIEENADEDDDNRGTNFDNDSVDGLTMGINVETNDGMDVSSSPQPSLLTGPTGSSSGGESAKDKVNGTVTISHDEVLMENDILWWSGSGNAIGELRKIPGLAPLETDQIRKIGQSADRRLVQAVVARKGPLVGKSIKQSKFRTRFNCAVIAVHREGTKVKDMPGRIVLQAGDVLLLEAGQNFVKDNKDNTRCYTVLAKRESCSPTTTNAISIPSCAIRYPRYRCFALLSELDDSTPPRLKLLLPALLLAVTMLAVYSAGVATLLETALCASAGMIMIGILTQQEARDSINWEIYITIAAAFGIGKAMVNSGVAGGVASGLSSVGKSIGIGDAGIYAMIYLATFLISNVVTNNAAAALIFPIGIDVALDFGTDPKMMAYCIMLSASASFMSPFGYQTNLMVYGPGGYKYVDFLKFGTPMQVVLWLFTVGILAADSTVVNAVIIWISSLVFMLAAFFFRIWTEMRSKS